MRNNNKIRTNSAFMTNKRGATGNGLDHSAVASKTDWSFVIGLPSPPKANSAIYNRIFRSKFLFKLYGLFAAFCWRIGKFFFKWYILFEHRYGLFLSDSVNEVSH